MKKNLQIPRGADWWQHITVKNQEGSILDFSGVSFSQTSCVMRKEYDSATGYTLGVSFADGGTTGIIILSFQAASTASLNWGSYVYDVKTTSTTNAIRRPLEGRIDLTPNVS